MKKKIPAKGQIFRASSPVSLQPSLDVGTPDLFLWATIKKSAQAMSFESFQTFMEILFSNSEDGFAQARLAERNQDLNKLKKEYMERKGRRALPFNDTDAYRNIKIAAETFVMVNCGFQPDPEALAQQFRGTFNFLEGPLRDDSRVEAWMQDYLVMETEDIDILPYLAVIRRKYPDAPIINNLEVRTNGQASTEQLDEIYGLLSERVAFPMLLELIWSYWHEESMLVQCMNAICRRFQNVRAPGSKDSLAALEIDPLRPLNNILWGFIQDEQHRLTVKRRAYEYDHHYGISLQGTAVGKLQPVDSRSKFIEAFHTLLNLCSRFFKQADDMTVKPDGFPILNALKEVHLILTEGAHNQYGDLPSTSRIEMLMMQWILARPEFRDFLAGRPMVAYPEAWMDRVAMMNNLQGWTDTSVLHFRDLGRFGEQILLSIRFGNWLDVNDREFAANWARFWRSEVQGYIHAYRAATGIDLSTEITGKIDTAQPSVHLFRRWQQQRKKKTA